MGIKTAVTRVALPTSTGDVDITTSALGGLVPKAVLFFVTNSVTDNTAADHSAIAYGVATAVGERWCAVFSSKNAVTTTLTYANATPNACISMIDPTDATTTDGQADFVTFITNGVRINVSDAFAGAYLATVVFFAGSDLTARAGSTALGNTVDLLTDVNTVGFKPDVVLTSDVLNAGRHSFGFVHESGGTIRQYSFGGASRNAINTTNEGTYLRSDAGITMMVAAANNLNFYGEFSAFDNQGFSITTRNAGGGNSSLRWLALNFNGAASAWVGNHTTPTSTGNASDTQPGFRPQLILQIQTLGEAVNTTYQDSRGGSVAFAAMDGSVAYAASYSREDGAGTSNTQTLSDDVAVRLPDHTGAAKLTGTLQSFDATGWTYNYSAVDAAAKLFPTLVIGESNENNNSPGPITIVTMRAAVNTATGNQDFTTTDLGGRLPKAAILIITGATADNTATNGATIGIGAVATVAQQWSARVFSRHGGVGNSTTNGTGATSSVIAIYNHSDGTNAGEAAFVSWITNGIRINWTTAPAGAYLMTIIFFTGYRLSAAVGTINVGDTVNLETDLSNIGFRPDVVFAVAASADAKLSVGVIREDGAGTVTQACFQTRSTDAQATTSEGTHVRTDAGVLELTTSTVLDWYGEFANFDVAGFSIITRNAGGNSRIVRYLALRFEGEVRSWVGTHSTPTSTGDSSVSSVGFKPQFLFQLQTLAEAVNTAYTDDRGGSVAIGAVGKNALAYSNSFTREDNVTTSNTQSLSDDQLCNLPTQTGANLLKSTLVSFNSNGWTANYSNVDAAAKLFPTLAIEVSPSGFPFSGRKPTRFWNRRRFF